ncbi:alpha-amylase [Candidatus Falkowbacteria bacterium]|nr:MAG: alpha-amylase [Candidatus Falkowbacteria bacterium]
MKNLKNKLKKLYPKDFEKTYGELVKIINDFKKKNPVLVKKQGPIFTQKDVVLICYADHVQEKGVKNLQTMQKFLHKYAKGFINKIHFLPFYDCSDIDDGFSVKDYYKIKTSYGDWSNMKKINKDFSFMFDLVCNHASIQGKIARKQLAGAKKYQDYFLIFDKKINTSNVFRPRTHPLLTPVKTSDGAKFAWTTFSHDQIDWNFNNPAVLLEMVKILLFYFSRGAKAIRLDAVAYCWKKSGTACFDLPECHILVQIFREVFRKVAPQAWAIAETVLPHERNIKYLGDGHNESHFVYNFALETLLLHTFLQEDATVATNWLNSISNNFGNETNILNLSVSHDGVHVIPAKGILSNAELMAVAKDSKRKGGKVLYRSVPGGKEPYELNITYPSAIWGIRKYLASQAIQMALKGVPLIYFNNLIGAENWSEGVKKLRLSRAINRQKFNYDELITTLENPNSRQHKIYYGYTKLLKARINEPLFSPLTNQKLLNYSKHILTIHRYNKNKHLIALTNVSGKTIKLNLGNLKTVFNKKELKNIINGNKYKLDSNILIKPYEVLWLK